MSDALITLNNISLSHNGKNILDDVSFKLHPGEFITLIGPNGAGKSSLIKILLGVIKQDAGEIIHSGNLKLGYTPQIIYRKSIYSNICYRFFDFKSKIRSCVYKSNL